MNHGDLEQFVELLYPFIVKKLKDDAFFKSTTKIKNATVVKADIDGGGSNIDKHVGVEFPYDTTSFNVLNKTGEELKTGDNVCLLYWIDLKNAVAIFKVKE